MRTWPPGTHACEVDECRAWCILPEVCVRCDSVGMRVWRSMYVLGQLVSVSHIGKGVVNDGVHVCVVRQYT